MTYLDLIPDPVDPGVVLRQGQATWVHVHSHDPVCSGRHLDRIAADAGERIDDDTAGAALGVMDGDRFRSDAVPAFWV